MYVYLFNVAFFSSAWILNIIKSDAELSCLSECFVYRLIVDSDSLTISDVTENDAGVYTCIMNTTLDRDSASAELTVVGTFSISLTHKTNSQIIKV